MRPGLKGSTHLPVRNGQLLAFEDFAFKFVVQHQSSFWGKKGHGLQHDGSSFTPAILCSWSQSGWTNLSEAVQEMRAAGRR